jgi:hypothetical protein
MAKYFPSTWDINPPPLFCFTGSRLTALGVCATVAKSVAGPKSAKFPAVAEVVVFVALVVLAVVLAAPVVMEAGKLVLAEAVVFAAVVATGAVVAVGSPQAARIPPPVITRPAPAAFLINPLRVTFLKFKSLFINFS